MVSLHADIVYHSALFAFNNNISAKSTLPFTHKLYMLDYQMSTFAISILQSDLVPRKNTEHELGTHMASIFKYVLRDNLHFVHNFLGQRATKVN